MISVFEDLQKNEIFNKKGKELTIRTKGIFRVEEDKKRMDTCLRGIIYESELVSFLKSINIPTFSIRILEAYINKVKDHIDINTVSLALELYKMLHT